MSSRYIACLKQGTGYSADYVNNLYNSVNKHCTLDYTFVCVTDDSTDLLQDIKVIKIPEYVNNIKWSEKLPGCWGKPYLFSKDIQLTGTILYFDLDVVISGNIDKLFDYNHEEWCTIHDYNPRGKRLSRMNSSVMRFPAGEMSFIWENMLINLESIKERLHGGGKEDQAWIDEQTSKYNYLSFKYPDEWCLSWKFNIRNKKYSLQSTGNRSSTHTGPGTVKTGCIEDVTPPPDCCVCIFHGDPKPHNCLDPWVINNWR